MPERFRAFLSHGKQFLTVIRERRQRASTSLERLRERLAPVFLIGGNRSGTSVVSSLLSQHPQLEGLFRGPLEPVYDRTGHARGYCVSFHVWPHLHPSDRKRRHNLELPFWALPQHVSDSYRHHARNDRERFELAWAIERLRTTNRQPLVNDHFNMFRIGLITDVLPRARFVLVTRSWRDFLQTGVHKWTHDRSETRFSAANPRGGLHWHLMNLIARYDLGVFAADRYAEVWLDTLQEGPDPARAACQQILERLSLDPFAFDLRLLEPYWAKRREFDRVAAVQEHDFDLIRRIVQFERELLQAVGKP